MNLESWIFILNKYLVIGKKKKKIRLQEMNVCFVSHFEPLSLRCEMTITPLNRISGCDTKKNKKIKKL